MLCRAVLTATAISYVICVLLLSGLQKEDLDTSTLEKLRRHNVNIYDMNNENLKQDCLIKSITEPEKINSDFAITEDVTTTMLPITTKSEIIERNVRNVQQSETDPENYYLDKNHLKKLYLERMQNFDESLRTSTAPQYSDEIIETTVEENKYIKTTEAENVEGQESLENVMKFWMNLARKHTSQPESTSKTTTTTQNTQPTKIVTSTSSTIKPEYKAKVNPKDAEYVNKIIAEYLATRTVSTTTEMTTRKPTNIDAIARQIKAILAKKTQEGVDRTELLKNIKSNFGKNLRELVDLRGLTIKQDVTTTKNPSELSQKSIDNDDNREVKILRSVPLQATKYSPLKIDKKTAQRNQALQYLGNILRLNNQKLKTNPPILNIETTPENIIVQDEQIEYDNPQIEADYTTEVKSTKSNSQVTVSADVIQAIAEKVKEIVMKDIRKEIRTTEAVTLSTTTTSTFINTEESTTARQENNNNRVLQTFMSLFNEYKAGKESKKKTASTQTDGPLEVTVNSKKSTFPPPFLDRLYPPVMTGLNPYKARPVPSVQIQQNQMQPWQNLVPIALGPKDKGPDISYIALPLINQRNEKRPMPITLQTNLNEIPPLVIQVSKPTLISQNILVTTENPFEKRKEEQLQRESKQRLDDRVTELLGKAKGRYVKNAHYDDLTNKLRTDNMKKEYQDSYHERIQRLKDRIKQAHEHNREKAHSLASDHRLDRLLEDRHSGFEGRPGASYRETLKHRDISQKIHPNDPKHHDYMTHEVLSRFADSNYRNVLSRLLESNPSVINRPQLNHQSDRHHSDAWIEQERSYPRETGNKFHEKLEKLEDYRHLGRLTTESCCDIVAARQQMPLTKLKQRTRFDDTHFKNFLKSQQKVTDMLEKILAKNKPADETVSIEAYVA